MFSLFKKESLSIPYIDKVWKTEESAIKGMLMMAMMRLQKGQSCFIISFFESQLEKIASFMNANQLKFVKLDGAVGIEVTEPTLFLADAPSVSLTSLTDFLKRSIKLFSGEVFFPGHYPVTATENKTLDILSTLGFNTFIFCLSFDDPLLKMFNSQSILPLLEKLGLEDEEAIEHNMVTQSIKRAREKVEKKMGKEILAKSPEEWFTLNVKK